MRKGRASGSMSGAAALEAARRRSRSQSRSMRERHSFSSLRPRPSNGVSSKRWLRVLGALGYAFSVSLVAVLLALYYTFLWTPQLRRAAPPPNAEDIVKAPQESLSSIHSSLAKFRADNVAAGASGVPPNRSSASSGSLMPPRPSARGPRV